MKQAAATSSSALESAVEQLASDFPGLGIDVSQLPRVFMPHGLRKLRVLFLHGVGSDAQLTERLMTLTGWTSLAAVEWVFVDAPYVIAARPDDDGFRKLAAKGYYDAEKKYRTWGLFCGLAIGQASRNVDESERKWREGARLLCEELGHSTAGQIDSRSIQKAWQETQRYVQTVWKRYGPFDGISGMCEGAAVAAFLARSPLLEPRPNFLMSIEGFPAETALPMPSMQTQHNADKEEVTIPSFHLMGSDDGAFQHFLFDSLLDQFRRQGGICEWGAFKAGRAIPILTEELETITLKFLQRALGSNGAGTLVAVMQFAHQGEPNQAQEGTRIGEATEAAEMKILSSDELQTVILTSIRRLKSGSTGSEVQAIPVDVTFAELGLGSFEWLMIRQMLMQTMKRSIPAHFIYQAPTISSLAEELAVMCSVAERSPSSAEIVQSSSRPATQPHAMPRTIPPSPARGPSTYPSPLAAVPALVAEQATEDVLVVDVLNLLLQEAHLQSYLAQAQTWCESMGVATLEELLEYRMDFEDALQLKPLEKRRFGQCLAKQVRRSGGASSDPASDAMAISPASRALSPHTVGENIRIGCGVIFEGPVTLADDVVIKDDVRLGGGCQIENYSVIGPRVSLGEHVTVESFSTLLNDVQMGDNCHVYQHATLKDHVILGAGCKVHQQCVFNGPIIAQKDNVFREFCIIGVCWGNALQTFNGLIRIGSECVFAASSQVLHPHGRRDGSPNETMIGNGVHVAGGGVSHDCTVEDHVLLLGELTGYCHVMKCTKLGVGVSTHQFTTYGTGSFIMMGVSTTFDVLPYCAFDGKTCVVDRIAMSRQGYEMTAASQLHDFYMACFTQPSAQYLRELDKTKRSLMLGQWFEDELLRFFKVRQETACKRSDEVPDFRPLALYNSAQGAIMPPGA